MEELVECAVANRIYIRTYKRGCRFAKQTKTYVFDQELFSNGQYGPRKTKVTKNIDHLKKTGAIGFISSKRNLLSRSIKTADIKHPNNRQPLCEVKDVAIKLLDLL